jgi:diacylglycerol kinase family enzyme
VRHHRARRVIITSTPGVCVHADGEILDDAAERLEVEVLPRRLPLLA